MRVTKALARGRQRPRVAAARLRPLHFDSIRTSDCCALPTGCRPASPAGLVHLAPALRAWLGFFELLLLVWEPVSTNQLASSSDASTCLGLRGIDQEFLKHHSDTTWPGAQGRMVYEGWHPPLRSLRGVTFFKKVFNLKTGVSET